MQPLRVLLLEDKVDDAKLTLKALSEGGYQPDAVWIDRRSQFEDILQGPFFFDVILADFSLPDLDGRSALTMLRQNHSTPFILLSGALGEEIAVDMLKQGATDVVLKHRLGRLVPAVRRALREVQEIRERFRIEEELQRANRRFQQATELVNAVIYEWDLKAGTVQRSPSVEKLIGYTHPELPVDSNWWRQQIHPEDLPACFETLNNLSPGSKTIYSEYRVKHAHGHYVYVCDRAFLDWEGDQVVRMLGITEDISQHKANEETLRKAKDAAEAANNAKSMFLANMSHEIRTPLGAILGFTELCLTSSLNDTEKAESLKTVKKNGALLSRIIDDILDLSKVEAGKLDIEILDVSLAEIVGDVLTLLHVQAEAKGLRLRVKNEGPIPRQIRTDPTRLRQILLNIVGNALKFTEQGEVLLLIRWQPKPGDPGHSMLEFEVKDTGIGISSDHAASLFKLFSQSDPSTTRRFGGTGLGLVLSRRLAQALQGDVSLHTSSEGQGSTFRILIDPQCGAHPALMSSLDQVLRETPPTLSATAQQRLDQVRILLVDDVLDNLVMIRLFLQAVGARVETVSTGAAGIARAMQGDLDLILMDIQMPGMDGHQAACILRQSGFQKPIIALTAHAMREERDRCLASGFTAYLTKPIEPKTLYETIARHVEGPRALFYHDTDNFMVNEDLLDPADFGLRVGPMDKFVAELIRTDPELREIRNSFLRNLQQEFSEMRSAFAAGDYQLLRDRVHAMRGSAGNYGFVDLFTWATAVEQELADQKRELIIAEHISQLNAFASSAPAEAGRQSPLA